MQQVFNPIPLDFVSQVTLGLVPGYRANPIGGFNANMQADTEETIWDQGGIYTYLTSDTQLYASSSSSADTMQITVIGLTRDFTEVTRTVTLSGQSQVALDGLMYRVHQGLVDGSVEPQGDIYIAESDTLTAGVPDTASRIKAKIALGNNVTEMAMFTTPKDTVALYISDNYIAGKGSDIIFKPIGRVDGGLFQNFGLVPIYQQAVEFSLPGLIVPEGFDLEVRGTSGNEGAIASFFLDIILVDTSIL